MCHVYYVAVFASREQRRAGLDLMGVLGFDQFKLTPTDRDVPLPTLLCP